MNGVEALLISFDGAWKDNWESLADACKDLTDNESSWQPPAYANEPHDDGVGRPGTILWHLNHLVHCHRHYLEVLRMPPSSPPPETRPPGELPLAAVLDALESATAELRNELAGMRPERLTAEARPNRNIASFAAMFTRHMSWHAAQIKVARRLHARR